MADVWLCKALNGQKLAQIPCFSQTSLKAKRVAFQIVHTHTGKQTAGVEGRVGGAITLYPEQHVTLIVPKAMGNSLKDTVCSGILCAPTCTSPVLETLFSSLRGFTTG